MRKNAARERNRANIMSSMSSVDQPNIIIANPCTSLEKIPKLLETVIKALPEESPAAQLLTQGSKRIKRRKPLLLDNPSEVACNLSTTEPERKSSVIEPQILSVENEKLENLGPPSSPDLLSAIQAALSHQNRFMNLTDTEKAFIVNGDGSSVNPVDDNSDFLDPIDGRKEYMEQDNLSKLNGNIESTTKDV